MTSARHARTKFRDDVPRVAIDGRSGGNVDSILMTEERSLISVSAPVTSFAMRRFSIFDRDAPLFTPHSANVQEKLTAIRFSLNRVERNRRILQSIRQPAFHLRATALAIGIWGKGGHLGWRALLSSTSAVRSIGNVAEKCLHIRRNVPAKRIATLDAHVCRVALQSCVRACEPRSPTGISAERKIPSLARSESSRWTTLSLEITAQICRVFNPSAA